MLRGGDTRGTKIAISKSVAASARGLLNVAFNATPELIFVWCNSCGRTPRGGKPRATTFAELFLNYKHWTGLLAYVIPSTLSYFLKDAVTCLLWFGYERIQKALAHELQCDAPGARLRLGPHHHTT